MGIFLFRTWAERRNMASTAEPFSRAIWSSRSRERKPARSSTARIRHTSYKAACRFRCATQEKKIPGIFLVNSTRTWTWLVAISVSSRKFSSVLYWSWSWKASFTVSYNKFSLLKHLDSGPHQFLCHILRNLMFVVSICDGFHERLLFVSEFNRFLRGTNPPRGHILAINTEQTSTL